MGLFAPPDLFAAVAAAALSDRDLADGVHLRLLPAPVLGFPAMPFAVYAIQPRLADVQVEWRDRRGNLLAGPTLDAAGGVIFGDITPPGLQNPQDTQNEVRDLAVELLTDGSFEGSIALLDRIENRVFSHRLRPPFIVGGPRVERVGITGRGLVTGIRTWQVDASLTLEQMLNREPVAILSLPIDGERPWYAKGQGQGGSRDRVKRGAPRRLTPPDRPDGPFDPVDANDEVARVRVHADEIDPQCETMVGDLAIPPRAQRRKDETTPVGSPKKHIVDLGIASTLLAQAMDPGIGRYLGLVDAIDERTAGDQPLAYAAIGLYLYGTLDRAPDGRVIEVAMGTRPNALHRLEEQLIERFGAQELLRQIFERHSNAGRGFAVHRSSLISRGLVAIAGAVPAAEPPTLPKPAPGNANWLPGSGGPSNEFRQDFLFPDAPMGALVAVGRRDAGTWTTRHRMIDLPPSADPAERAVARLIGRTRPTPKPIGPSPASGSYLRRGLISDAPIPASTPPALYRAAMADLFGRFGRPTEFDAAAPPRPRPPAPAPQPEVVLDGPDGIGAGAASPGHVHVSIVVPSVADIPNGSLDIASLALSLDGTAITPIPAGTVRMIVQDIPLPPLAVGAKGASALKAVFKDTAGVESEPALITVSYADRRQPPIVKTGLGLIWTSRPGPSPEVELKLTWPAAPNTKYRVYIADEKGLGLAGPSRAEIAVTGGERDRNGTLGGRKSFRLLTDPPLVASNNQIVLDERLPRALSTVQFVRVVPVTDQGRETDFAACGVVAIAVPSDRTPPPPRVRAEVNAQTAAATITITADGLDLVALDAAEPGLFTQPPGPGAVAPEFRLRRASGLVPDPVYAREIARGPLRLARDAAGHAVFSAEVADPLPLQPFVRYSYWAEVRMPPERRLARVVELPPAAGVGPVNPSQIADMPQLFSPASAPGTTLFVPAPPVAELAGAAAAVALVGGQQHAQLTAPTTPTAAAKAVGAYTLKIWEQWGDTSMTLVEPGLELDGSALAWDGPAVPVDAAHPRPLTLRFVVTDPVGRDSDLTTIAVP